MKETSRTRLHQFVYKAWSLNNVMIIVNFPFCTHISWYNIHTIYDPLTFLYKIPQMLRIEKTSFLINAFTWYYITVCLVLCLFMTSLLFSVVVLSYTFHIEPRLNQYSTTTSKQIVEINTGILVSMYITSFETVNLWRWTNISVY